MRVERLGRDTIRFYLSMDDLVERGIEKEDMWRDHSQGSRALQRYDGAGVSGIGL